MLDHFLHSFSDFLLFPREGVNVSERSGKAFSFIQSGWRLGYQHDVYLSLAFLGHRSLISLFPMQSSAKKNANATGQNLILRAV